MSVTFRPNHPDAFRPLLCARCAENCVTMEQRWDCDCDCHFAYAAPSVNMANGNAADVMRHLGYDDFDYRGTLGARDLQSRCLLARMAMNTMAGVDDSGIPSVTNGNVTMCGVPAGYYEGRIGQLEAIATWAIEHDVDVSYA